MLTPRWALLIGLVLLTAGCETDPERRPLRAGRSPVSGNSAEREVLADPPGTAVPLVEVTVSGKKDVPPRVRTIADPIREAQRDLAEREAGMRPAPATRPAPDPLDTRGSIDLVPRGTPTATRP